MGSVMLGSPALLNQLVGPQQDRLAAPGPPQQPDDTGLGQSGLHLEAMRAESLGHEGRRLALLPTKLRMVVQVAAVRNNLRGNFLWKSNLCLHALHLSS